jgi:cytochrome d ubiquinol oxidase subunit II
MAECVLAVVVIAATLYTVLAGADFGAGIIEGTLDRKGKERVDVALAPVWEANHVWLVLIVVLLFVGFPRLYALMSVNLHIPLMFALLGIVARGSAFTFRHYDPTSTFDRWYSGVFRFASVLAPVSLGLVLAATASGTFPVEPPGDFYGAFIAPWNTLFGWATAAFVCALFAFQGAALLSAEHARVLGPLPYLRTARRTHFVAIGCGALVLFIAWIEDLPWFAQLVHSSLAVAAIGAATLLIAFVAFAFHAGHPWLLRLALGAQVFCILLGFLIGQYPFVLRTTSGGLGYRELAAPDATLETLLVAVGVGLVLIVPGLWYLIAVYKGDTPSRLVPSRRPVATADKQSWRSR